MPRSFLLTLLLIAILSVPSFGEEPEISAEQIRAIVETPLVVQADLEAEAIEVRRDIHYTADGAAGPTLDLYRPRQWSVDPRPVLLYVHGGPLDPEVSAEPILRPKDWRFYRDHGRLAVAHGFIALVPNHRYASTAAIETSFADLRAALDWLRKNAASLGADPDRVGIWLFSGAGAHLGWLREAGRAIRAAVAFYPVAEFAAFEAMGMGKTPAEIVERWDPTTHADASLPPLLLARADRDQPAINASIDTFVARAVAGGATLDLLLHPEGQHGFDVRDDLPRSHEIVARSLDFFADHLGR